jgi:hypothetical protein
LPAKRIPPDVRSLARAYTKKAIEVLGGIMVKGDKEAARVAAAGILLDRGWGRPPQPLTGDPDEPIIVEIINRVRSEKK